MNSHLQTAHQYGVQKALEKLGYKTVEEVQKEAAELGLLEQPTQQPQQKTAEEGVFAALKAKLG